MAEWNLYDNVQQQLNRYGIYSLKEILNVLYMNPLDQQMKMFKMTSLINQSINKIESDSFLWIYLEV